MERERIEADFLVAGGGPAGLMAAIHASEQGAKVVVAEKGNTLRSGSAATGVDHISYYNPEIHGDAERIIAHRTQESFGRDVALARTLLVRSGEVVSLWDRWGIPVKYQGHYEFAGHAYPGQTAPSISLKIQGINMKRTLTEEAQKRGVQILNRVMVTDLLRDDNGIVGAVGVHTRENKLYELQAKAAFLGTGMLIRLYPSPTPGWMFNCGRSPVTTGDGRAMAYRVGAQLVSLEMPLRWSGPKYFTRHGKATWIGVFRDPDGKPVGPFVTTPDRRYGDATSDVYPFLFNDYHSSGKGPVYMDCDGISDEDFEYMRFWFRHEGLTSVLDYFEAEDLDPRKNPVEFTTYQIYPMGGIYHNEKAETSLPGLYAGGDEFQGASVTGAAVFGWVGGESAAEYVKAAPAGDIEKARATIEARADLVESMRGREIGPDWKEVNIALQQIMYDYAGDVRSETLLNAGLKALRRLQEKAHKTMIARNQHEVSRALEVFNLMELGELIFLMAKERKETRGRHIRPDYPFTNPLMAKGLVVTKVGDKPVMSWREARH